MSKREKILITASLAAFIWGAVMIVRMLEKQNISPSGPIEDMAQFVGKVSESVNADPSEGLNDIILSQARGTWGKDPFYTLGPVNFDPKEELHYQGYVRSGSRMFALINNREYRVGDEIDGSGISIKGITPNQVVLMVQGRKKRILPIEGDL